jgi:hypothetical protein
MLWVLLLLLLGECNEQGNCSAAQNPGDLQQEGRRFSVAA